MTDTDLATLVRDHVTHDEPPFLLSAETSIVRGRRTLRRRRTTVGLVGVALAVSAVVVVPRLGGNAPAVHHGIDPATAVALRTYDAQKMPTLLDDHVSRVLSRSVPDLGPVTFTALDGQGVKLPTRYYDKASGMQVVYRDSGHQYELDIAHARSEAEGNARKICKDDMAAGEYFSCDVTTDDRGDVLTTTVEALRPWQKGWAVLRPEELRTGIVDPTDAVQTPIRAGQVWMRRQVKAVHSQTFVSYASETQRVQRVSTIDTMLKDWTVPLADLQQIATDPVLVIPKPPVDARGCTWSLPGSGYSCS